MKLCIVDIETMSASLKDEQIEAIQAIETAEDGIALAMSMKVSLGNIKKDVDKMKAALLNSADKSGLDTNRLIIACIGFKVVNVMPERVEQETQVLWNRHYTGGKITAQDGEAELLKNFADNLPVRMINRWVGHNAKGFDIPAIWKRAVKYGIADLTEYVPHDKHGNQVDDTMQMWAGTDYHNKTSLDTIAKFLDLEGKKGIDGSMVKGYIEAGKIDEITEYCKNDVETTWAIHQKM